MERAAEARAASSRGSSGSCPYSPPSLHVAQPYGLTLAPGAAALARAAGIELQDWQSDVLSDMGACDASGKFVHRRVYLSIPRQAGKSTVTIAWALALVLNGYRVLWTCHNYSTTCEMRRRFQDVLGSRRADKMARLPEFNAYVSDANNKTGQESIELSTGGVLAFSTRTASAALGYSFDVIVYDEAQELTDEQQQAILPTFTSGAMHNPQVVFTGTPLRPGRPGTVFARDRLAIARGEDGSADFCLWEWGVGEVGDVRDEGRWAAVNPSIGRVANVDAIRVALSTMTELAFAQEYLGYWLPTGTGEQPDVDPAKWDALATDDPPRGGRWVLAFKFSPDGRTVAVAACRRGQGGRPHVEVVRYAPLDAGAAWCADFAEARLPRFGQDADTRARCAAGAVVDGGGYGRDLRDELARRRVWKNAVVDPGAQGMAAACARLLSGVDGAAFTHYGQPALDACAKAARKRPIGRSGFGFECVGGLDPTMVEACALALWGIDAVKCDPERRAYAR